MFHCTRSQSGSGGFCYIVFLGIFKRGIVWWIGRLLLIEIHVALFFSAESPETFSGANYSIHMAFNFEIILHCLANRLVCFFCSDIYSVSNVLTSEFQSAILLKCQDETELSLVEYMCHGPGLLLLQMLCILASKVMIVQNKLVYMYMYILILNLSNWSHVIVLMFCYQ